MPTDNASSLQTTFKHAALAVTSLYKEAKEQRSQGYQHALTDLHSFIAAYRSEFPSASTIHLDVLTNYLAHKQQQQQQQQQSQQSMSPSPVNLPPSHHHHPSSSSFHSSSHHHHQQQHPLVNLVDPGSDASMDESVDVMDARRKEGLATNSMMIARALELMDDRQHPTTTNTTGATGTSAEVHPQHKRIRLPKRGID